ncbi:MAG: hypothetical protein COA66_15620 [Arcobacter sp.]|nr:MAG: hypothetical protein COA66_15620 [Arcobacter sp.]
MRLGILCPGQGSQSLQMLDILKDNLCAQEILNIAKQYVPNEVFTDTKEELIFKNEYAQVLICATQLALWNAIKNEIPTPSLFAGYSLGELSIYGCVGSLSYEESISLAHQRALMMNASSPKDSRLLSSKNVSYKKIQALCEKTGVYISIVNVDNHFIIGGENKKLSIFEDLAKEEGASIKALSINVASHTPLLKKASESFLTLLEKQDFKTPLIPTISSIDCDFIYEKDMAIATLSKQISQKIQWKNSLETMLEYGCDTVLELGPGNVLSKMLQKLDPNIKIRSVSDFKTIQGVISWLNKG